MKSKTSNQEIVVGRYYELLQDFGPIPKGIYRLCQREDDSLVFQVGNKIIFTITGNWDGKIVRIPPHVGRLRQTTQSYFLDRYYDKLWSPPICLSLFDPSQPITMCGIDSSIAREFN